MIHQGQKINDRYQIIRSIGEGGMANVYLAYDTILDRNVAVKILRGDLANDEKFVRRFQREAISASSLSHPNIVEMYDVGEDNGKYFIVMEYLEGQTLKSLIKKRGSLTLHEVVDIMLQITSGLMCAHESYIIHRDIKPQNIVILEDGRIKITDFGISMALNSNELTQTNSVMGSVHYLPPEQANGSGATAKSDIYSAGILMYELLTGKLPFKGENAVEIAIKQMRDPIPSLTKFYPEIPQSVENIILKATAKNLQNRYDSVKEMNDDLKVCLDKSHANDRKIVYIYPEQEMDDEKIISNEDKQKEEKMEKKINKALLITGIITAILAIIALIMFIIMPHIGNNKEVEIPDVVNMTEKKAIKELEKLDLKVNALVKEESSDEIEAGNVIKTNPKVGKKVKKGTSITLTVSIGTEEIEIEDYTGKKYEDVEYLLEKQGIKVSYEEKEFTEDDNVEEGTIVSQDIKSGETLKKGDSISFEIVKLITVYPDFVNESYTIDEVKKFCEKNNIVLEAKTKETNDYKENTIIYQSRPAGGKVVSGVSLTVTYAIKKEEVKEDNNVSSEKIEQSDTKENITNESKDTTTTNSTSN